MSAVEKRIFIGGLVGGVTQQELEEKFARFGQVKNIEIKKRQNEIDAKIFAYVNLCSDEDKFKKCFSAYNNTKWKGGQLKLQFAKESFLSKLEQERRDEQDQRAKEKTKENSLPPSPAFDRLDTKAAPGTPIEGKKDWVMGKYSRPLPVLHVKKPQSGKIVTLDPSKTTHALKKIKADDFDNKSGPSLTWRMEVRDTEITKKRKGQFPPWQPSKKSSGDIVSRMHQLAAETHETDDELEVVSTTRMPGFTSRLTGYQSDGSDSAGSADTDEIIAQSSKIKSAKIGREKIEHDIPKYNATSDANSTTKQNAEKLSKRKENGVVTSISKQTMPVCTDRDTAQNSEKRTLDSDSDSDSDSDENGVMPPSSSSIPRPKFVKVDKCHMKASVRPAKVGPKITTESSAASDSDEGDKGTVSKSSTAVSKSNQPMPTDSDDSDSERPQPKKKKKKQQKQNLQKVPEFKGLSMLSDYSDEDLVVKEPQKQTSDVFTKTPVVLAVVQETNKARPRHTDKISSDSSEEENDAFTQTHERKPRVALKDQIVVVETQKFMKSPAKSLSSAKSQSPTGNQSARSHHPTPDLDDDDSADTDDILSASASKRKPQPRRKTALSEQRLFSNSEATLDEFDSGLAEPSRRHRHAHLDSDDSDFDSNDFELVAKKIASNLQGKEHAGQKKSKTVQVVPKADSTRSVQKAKSTQDLQQSAKAPMTGSGQKQKNSTSPANLVDASNQRRLQAIAEKNAEQQRQQALIKKALEGDKMESKSHKFFSDSDAEDNTESSTANLSTEKRVSMKQSQLQLFSGYDPESSEEEEDADHTFRLRPQFEGAKGHKLMALQTRFGRDMRFRMDERFQESGSDEDEEENGETEENAGEEEKSRAMKILESVLGHKVKVPKHKDRIFKDMNKLRYIPGSEACKHMEVPDVEPKKKKPKAASKEEGRSDDSSPSPDEKVNELPPEPEPKKKNDRYYEVSSNIKDLFSGSSTPFSFFGASACHDDDEKLETDAPHLHYSGSSEDFSDAEMSEASEVCDEREPTPLTETTPFKIDTSSGSSRVKRWQDDPRLSAAVRYFKRSENWDEVVEGWNARRSNLMEFVRLRQKRHHRRLKERERGGKKKWSKF